jgi:hypothetical protein
MAAGRPTLYDSAYCERVVELGMEGKSRAQIASALGVAKATIQNWEASHPEFLAAMTHARDEAQAWWEGMGQAGLTMQGFNASLWAKNVSCRFREDYSEPKNVILSGDAANPVRTVNRVEIVAVEAKAAE